MTIPEEPTEANIKLILDLMMPIFEAVVPMNTDQVDGMTQIQRTVIWLDAVPPFVAAEMQVKQAAFVFRESKGQFFLGYKGTDFDLPKGNVWIPFKPSDSG